MSNQNMSDNESETEVDVVEVKASNTLVPNLTISVDKDSEEPTVEFQDEKDVQQEEGEDTGSGVEFKVEAKSFPHTKIYENKALKEMGLTPEEARFKKLNRAKRFQSPMLREEIEPDNEDARPSQDLMSKVEEYNKSNDIFKEIRLDAVHLYGLDDMSTEDIFSFFDDHYPSHIEWINDTSCNVVWKDEKSAARAIVSMSRVNKPRRKTTDEELKEPEEGKQGEQDDDDDDLDLMESDDEKMEVEEDKKVEPRNGSAPAPFTNDFRRCKKPFVKNGKKVLMRMRFADVNDKKTLGGSKRSQYYRKYGNPNYGNIRGVLSRSFMKRFHGRVAKQEYQGFKPGTDEAEQSHDTERKDYSAKKTATKRMYSEQMWSDGAKKAREDEELSSDSDEREEEKEDRELINSSAKDLEDAIPAGNLDEHNPPNKSTMIADRIAKKIETARRTQEDASNSGNLNVEIKGASSVWARLGKRPQNESRGIAVTVDNNRPKREERVMAQDKERSKLPRSLKERLGTKK